LMKIRSRSLKNHYSRDGRRRSLHRLGVRFRALRAFSLPVSVFPVWVATAAARRPEQWHWGALIAFTLGVALLHAAGNLLNDYFDFRSGVDRKVSGDEKRPGRFLVRGEMTPAEVLAQALGCLALSVPFAAYLVWTSGPQMLLFGGVAAVAVYAYTGPPLQLKYRALGEPLIFLVFGPCLMTGAAYAQTGAFEWSAVLLSVPVGFATTAILVGNNIRDHQEDSEARITTIAQVAGKAARLLYIFLVVTSAIGVAILSFTRFAPAVLGLSPVLLLLVVRALTKVWRGERLPDIDVQTARFESALLLFMLAGLILR